MAGLSAGVISSLQNGSALITKAKTDFISMSMYPHHIQYIVKYKREVLQEFTFSDEITAAAKSFLENVKHRARGMGINGSLTFVGVHNRRTDYREFLRKEVKGHLVSTDYFEVRKAKKN